MFMHFNLYKITYHLITSAHFQRGVPCGKVACMGRACQCKGGVPELKSLGEQS